MHARAPAGRTADRWARTGERPGTGRAPSPAPGPVYGRISSEVANCGG